MSALLTIVSQTPLGYIMVVYFDSIALFQQFLENLIWSRFSTVKSTQLCILWPVSLSFWGFGFFQLVNK